MTRHDIDETRADAAGEAPGGDRNVASHVFNVVAMIAGAVGLYWMIHTVGWAHVSEAITSVGPWFALILVLDVTALCLDAAALQAFMRPEARMVSYFRVLGAQASGRAISVLTPTGALGEPIKLTMLVGHAPRSRVLSSLVLLNLGQFYLSVIAITIGTPIVLLLVDLPHTAKVMIAIGFGAMLALVIAVAVLVRRGAVSTVVHIIRRIHLISEERLERWNARLVDVDRHIRELQRDRSHGTWKGILWLLGSKAVTWTSTIVLLATAGISLSPALVVAVLSVGVLIQWVSQIVPMGLGLADGGNYALFDLLGATGAHGMGVTLLNRARSIAIAILGLCAMATMWVFDRLRVMRMRRRLAELRASRQLAT